jgi:hypothetical protein
MDVAAPDRLKGKRRRRWWFAFFAVAALSAPYVFRATKKTLRPPTPDELRLRSHLEQVEAAVHRRGALQLIPYLIEHVCEALVEGPTPSTADYEVKNPDGTTASLTDLRNARFRLSDELFVVWDQKPALPKDDHPRIALMRVKDRRWDTVAWATVRKDLDRGRHAYQFPAEFSQVPDFLMYVESYCKNLKWSCASVGALCIYRMSPQQGTIEVLPMDFWNHDDGRDRYAGLDLLFFDRALGRLFGYGNRYPFVLLSKDCAQAEDL